MSSDVAPDPYDLGLPAGWRQLDTFIIRTTEITAGIVGLSFAILIFSEIVSRYFFDFSIFWVDSIAQFLLVWFFLIGAGLALRRGAHVGFVYVVDNMPPTWARVAFFASRAIILLYCILMAWSGFLALGPALQQIEGATEISYFWVMLAFPVGFCLLIYHQMTLIVRFRSVLERKASAS
jgi:TRAP-type C4-dicarboxylate transport system permease small subunit